MIKDQKCEELQGGALQRILAVITMILALWKIVDIIMWAIK